jgi:hypothetical protein
MKTSISETTATGVRLTDGADVPTRSPVWSVGVRPWVGCRRPRAHWASRCPGCRRSGQPRAVGDGSQARESGHRAGDWSAITFRSATSAE